MIVHMTVLLTHKETSSMLAPRKYLIANGDRLSEKKIVAMEHALLVASSSNVGSTATSLHRNALISTHPQFSISRVPRARSVGQSYFTSIFTTIYAALFSIFFVMRFCPRLASIISNLM